MAPGDTAHLYFRLTRVEPGWAGTGGTRSSTLVPRRFVPNDLATWPAPCKTYAGIQQRGRDQGW